MLIHGGPIAREHREWNAEVQLLANRGCLVFRPQLRGSSGLGRSFEEAGFGEWGKAMQDDITDGVRHLVEQGIADPQRICIVGASYGGDAALWGPVKTPELYRCAVSFTGVTDIGYLFSDRGDLRFNKISRQLMKRHIGDRTMGEQIFDPVSPLKHAAGIKPPVLLMHGREDERVPSAHCRRMRDAVQANGKDVMWVVFNEEGHGLYRQRNQIAYFEAMLDFLGKHLPVAPQAGAPQAAPAAAFP